MAQKINVDITPSLFQQTLYYHQGDIGREFQIEVATKDGYEIPSGATFKIEATKPSGFGFTVTGTASGNVVSFTSTAEMTDEWGRFPAQLEISSGNTVLYTANFLMIGEKDTHPNSTIDGSQEEVIPQLTLLVERIEAAAERVDEEVAKVTGMTATATTLPAGSDATASYDSETSTLTFGIPRGADGDVQADGTYDEMTVGSAMQLLSSYYTEDKTPYKFRTTGGSADVGNREEVDAIVGGSIAWNQKMYDADGSANAATKSYDRSTNTVTLTPTNYSGNAVGIFRGILTVGHKFLVGADYYADHAVGARFGSGSGASSAEKIVQIPATTWTSVSAIINVTSGNSATACVYYATLLASGWTSGTFKIRNPYCFDLTQMFGSTIADYIYSMEQSNAGSGVKWFKSLFPNDYYEYNTGELISVSGLQSHDTVGFNQWDEEWEVGAYSGATGEKSTSSAGRIRSKNHIKVLPNTAYYATDLVDAVCFYDGEKNYLNYYTDAVRPFTTPSNCGYITFYSKTNYGATYKNDICINLSWSGWRNGEYEPYQKHSYPLDSSLTLRGIPKLSADNKMCYDGDEYKYDGTVTRKYGIVDLGTLNWQALSTNTSGIVRMGAHLTGIKMAASGGAIANVICTKYNAGSNYNTYDRVDKTICVANSEARVIVYDSDYNTSSDAASFKTALSGVYLVYELATPTEETAEPYQRVQVCDEYGTEVFVSTSITPVGHNTRYPDDLVKKLDNLPSDFSTLIAPTEKTTRASQNYSVGSYLIYNNTLYKVTSAIASGGTITVGANVSATTIMAEIRALQ